MPSEQPPTRVETCPTCGHPRTVITSDEGTSYFAPPSEQPREEPASPTPTEARIDLEWAFRLMHDCLQTGKEPEDDEQDRLDEIADALARDKTPTPTEQREGDDLAARLEEKSNVEEGLRPARPTNLPGPDLYHLGRAEAFAEAAQLARASTHPEQSERIVGAALDLLDSLGAPHYHDLIGMTYTLRKEQADNLRAALEPASPTPTEQGEDQ